MVFADKYCRPQKFWLDINFQTPHPPSPGESNGRSLNFVVNVGFASGVLRGVLGEYTVS